MAYRILIVDDENALQDMVREILTQAGYETDAALSCAQAVERFRVGNPDAVLLDVNLPDGDGFSLFGAARGPGRAGAVPLRPGRGRGPLRGLGSGRTTTSQALPAPGAAARLRSVLRRVYREAPDAAGSGTRRSTGARASCAATAWRPP